MLRAEHREYLEAGLEVADRAGADGAAAARRGRYAGRGSGGALELLQGDGAVAYRQCAREAAASICRHEETGMKAMTGSTSRKRIWRCTPRAICGPGAARGGASACRPMRAVPRVGGGISGRSRSACASAAEMPEGLDWDRLAAEMTANIRVGLAAGECVAPRGSANRPVNLIRQLASGGASSAGLAGGAAARAWWLNMPSPNTQALGRAMQRDLAWARQRGNPAMHSGAEDDRRPVVEVASDGNRAARERRSAGRVAGCSGPRVRFGEHAGIGQRALCGCRYGPDDHHECVCAVSFILRLRLKGAVKRAGIAGRWWRLRPRFRRHRKLIPQDRSARRFAGDAVSADWGETELTPRGGAFSARRARRAFAAQFQPAAHSRRDAGGAGAGSDAGRQGIGFGAEPGCRAGRNVSGEIDLPLLRSPGRRAGPEWK